MDPFDPTKHTTVAAASAALAAAAAANNKTGRESDQQPSSSGSGGGGVVVGVKHDPNHSSSLLHDSFSPNNLNEEVQLPPLLPQQDRGSSTTASGINNHLQDGKHSTSLNNTTTNDVSVIGDHSFIEVNFMEDDGGSNNIGTNNSSAVGSSSVSSTMINVSSSINTQHKHGTTSSVVSSAPGSGVSSVMISSSTSVSASSSSTPHVTTVSSSLDTASIVDTGWRPSRLLKQNIMHRRQHSREDSGSPATSRSLESSSLGASSNTNRTSNSSHNNNASGGSQQNAPTPPSRQHSNSSVEESPLARSSSRRQGVRESAGNMPITSSTSNTSTHTVSGREASERASGVSDRATGASDRTSGASDRTSGASDRTSGASDRASATIRLNVQSRDYENYLFHNSLNIA